VKWVPVRHHYRQQKKPNVLKVELVRVKSTRRRKMIKKGLIITGSDAELLSRALSEVKIKAYEESEAQLDDTEALNALVSGFMSAESNGHEKEKLHSQFNPLRKRLVLGTIIDWQVGTRD
jgi:hypothetical protein